MGTPTSHCIPRVLGNVDRPECVCTSSSQRDLPENLRVSQLPKLGHSHPCRSPLSQPQPSLAHRSPGRPQAEVCSARSVRAHTRTSCVSASPPSVRAAGGGWTEAEAVAAPARAAHGGALGAAPGHGPRAAAPGGGAVRAPAWRGAEQPAAEVR